MSVTCSVYGLGLESNVRLAELVGLPAAERVDLHLRLGALPSPHELAIHSQREWVVSTDLDDMGAPCFRSYRLEPCGGVRVDYADSTSVVIDAEGRQVWATWEPPLTEEDAATYLLGPIMGLVLRLRGIPCLHASAVAIDGGAVLFVGPSGAGKSSTAAAFSRRGHAIFSDDVVALDERPVGFVVRPGLPRIRLWPDSAEWLFGAEGQLPRIVSTWDKLFLDLRPAENHLYQREPLPLRAVYLLQERSALPKPAVTSVKSRDAVMALVTETYANRFQEGPRQARELEFLVRLVEGVPVRRLTPSADLSKLDELCDSIVADLRALPSGSSTRSQHGRKD